MNYLGALKTDQMELLNQIEGKILDRYKEAWVATDAVAAAIFIDSNVFLLFLSLIPICNVVP